jgi:hypothetical protein
MNEEKKIEIKIINEVRNLEKKYKRKLDNEKIDNICKNAKENMLEFFNLSDIDLTNEKNLEKILKYVIENQEIKCIVFNRESVTRKDLLQIDNKLGKLIFLNQMNFGKSIVSNNSLKFYDYMNETLKNNESYRNSLSLLDKIKLHTDINYNSESYCTNNQKLWHYYLCCIMALKRDLKNEIRLDKLNNSDWLFKGSLEPGVNNSIVLSALLYYNKKDVKALVSFPFSRDMDIEDEDFLNQPLFNIYNRVSNVLQSLSNLTNSKKEKISVTFVGYSVAAWYAELSVYLSVNMGYFEISQVEAITFESPGSFDFLNLINNQSENPINLRELKVTSFFCEPNFMNTLYKHIGEKHFISSDKEETKIIIKEYLRLRGEKRFKKEIDKLEKDLDDENNTNIVTFYYQGIF